MQIQHKESKKTIRIAVDGVEIDAHWNFFDDMADAKKYLGSVCIDFTRQYSFVETIKTVWDMKL